MPATWEDVAREVKRRRLDLGLSVRAAAKAGDMSTTTWLSLEKHHEPVTDAKRRGFAAALDLPPDFIDRMLVGLPSPDLAAAVDQGREAINEHSIRLGHALVAMEGQGSNPVTDSLLAGFGEMLIRWSELDRVDQHRVQTLVTLMAAARDTDGLGLAPSASDALARAVEAIDTCRAGDTDIREAEEIGLDDDLALAAHSGDEDLEEIDPTEGSPTKPRE